VSRRTIRNDLNEINGILKEHGKQELSVINGIITGTKDFTDVSGQSEDGDFYEYKLSRPERQMAVAAMLVNGQGDITLAAIAETLSVHSFMIFPTSKPSSVRRGWKCFPTRTRTSLCAAVRKTNAPSC